MDVHAHIAVFESVNDVDFDHHSPSGMSLPESVIEGWIRNGKGMLFLDKTESIADYVLSVGNTQVWLEVKDAVARIVEVTRNNKISEIDSYMRLM